MNLFCFSLEGSMDSLYEAVDASSEGQVLTVPSRSSSRPSSRPSSRACSPAVLLDDNSKRRGSGRSVSMEISQIHGANTKKKKRRTHVSKSASDNDALDNPSCDASLWPPARGREDLPHIANNHNEELLKTRHRAETKGGKGGVHPGTKKKEKPPPTQTGSYEGWSVSPERSSSRQRELGVHAKGSGAECKPVKRGQKAGKKANGKSAKEGMKKSQSSRVHSPSGPPCPVPAGPYLDVSYRPYAGKASTLPAQENATPGRGLDPRALPGGATPTHNNQHHHHQRWSNPAESAPAWGSSHHTCRMPLTEYRVYSHDGPPPREKDWEDKQDQPPAHHAGLRQEPTPLGPSRVRRSSTDVDLADPNRSTSFGRFEGLRHHPSPSKMEDDGTMIAEESVCDGSDPTKPSGLGKKMKAISLTMRRRMCKKHAKSFSEDAGDDTDRDPDGETESGPAAEKGVAKTSNSLESLYSGQSSSSSGAVTSVSEGGSSQRDSLRLEEDGSVQFCGRARVHTDFVPSPYDTDSLKLKVGDIISIISKPPMGIWTGRLNSKVGNFKFIYVDVLVEKEPEEEVPKIRQQKLCQRPRPKTLLELLERLQLEEYASALLLNGYQTVEDLLHLQEKHLVELNVRDPEHRRRLLAAADCRYTGDEVREGEEQKSPHQEENSDCPRDSGCFIPSECSDNTKEDGDHQADTAET